MSGYRVFPDLQEKNTRKKKATYVSRMTPWTPYSGGGNARSKFLSLASSLQEHKADSQVVGTFLLSDYHIF